jgi:hypothetical protein
VLGGFFYLKKYNMAKLKIRLSYGVIPNHVLKDKRLTAKAKGIFAYIQSKPDGWDFSAERIAEEMADGRESIRTGLIELEGVGLLIRSQWKNKDTGTFEHGYELFETSSNYPQSDLPMTENPTSEIPTSENRTCIKEIESKKEEVININTQSQVAIATVPKALDTFGNNDVNEIIKAIRGVCIELGYAYNKTDDRRAAHNLAVGKDFNSAAISHGMTVPQFCAEIVRLSSQSDFWSGKVTGAVSIRKHWTSVYNSGKVTFNKQVKETTVGVKSYNF